MLRYFLAGERAPPIKLNRRPSNQPLLPSPLGGKPQPTQARSRKVTAVQVLTVVVLLYWVVTLGGWVVGTTGQKKAAVLQLRRDSCEARGLVTATKDEQHRAVIRLRPAPPNELRIRNPDNTILPFSLHPSLSDALPRLFDGTSSPNAFPVGKTCVTPHIQQLPLHPRLESSPHEPEIFFSISTTPSRAVTSASIWSTFMSAPIPSTNDLATNNGRTRRPHAPGCLVTDAQNKGDSQGAAKAHAEFQRQGISCVFRDSTRASERYEMRVLSLVRDAWLESERRRWRDGIPIVEWFVFQDDDTWWTDRNMLVQLLSTMSSHEDHFLGGYSEAKGNFQGFGRIAYGGAGIIISRNLVRKMQGTLDECAARFGPVTFGGDGLLSNCAAYTQGISLDDVVEETSSMRQMDMKGDVSGYLTAGTAPFLTLHHWAGWLDLFPSRSGFDAITLFSKVTAAIGGPNFLRRFVFDDGAVVLTLGYSITIQREKLSPEALGQVEWTWEDHEPRRPARAGLEEGKEKLTYYLTAVERLSPTVALLKHRCTSPLIQSGLNEIDILYDVRTAKPSWSERLLGMWSEAKPSARAKAQERREREAMETRVREGGAFRLERREEARQEEEKVQEKREKPFSG